MRILRALIGRSPDRPRYVWSESRCIVHLATCYEAQQIIHDRQTSDDLADVARHCYRGCHVCLPDIPLIIPRETYQHTIPDGTPWVVCTTSKVAHKPWCGRLPFIRPENIQIIDDSETLQAMAKHGCRLCQTTMDVLSKQRGIIPVVSSADRQKDVAETYYSSLSTNNSDWNGTIPLLTEKTDDGTL